MSKSNKFIDSLKKNIQDSNESEVKKKQALGALNLVDCIVSATLNTIDSIKSGSFNEADFHLDLEKIQQAKISSIVPYGNFENGGIFHKNFQVHSDEFIFKKS